MSKNFKRLVPLLALIFGVLGCGLFSDGGDAELVFAPTEVGTPEGEKVTKQIGPAGGTLSSPDGRLTLTVPQNALTETIAFSMQPITNKAENGIGLAYRLEPEGMTFTTPLEISVRYDESDLEGTFPEALSIAYQDENGGWHAQRSAKLDQGGKTLNVSTTHFTDWAFLSRLRLSPTKATLRPGESQVIVLVDCKDPGLLDRLLSRPQNCGATTWANDDAWRIQGPGTYESGGPGTAIYQAPGKKPKPNYAWVLYSYELAQWDESRKAMVTVKGEVGSRITIVDSGYRATGQSSGLAFSGVICSVEKPFTVSGESMLSFKFNFTPSSENAGKVDITGSGFDVTIHNGSGTYVVEGIDTDRPRIALTGNFTGTHPRAGSATGSGTRYIDLVPLEDGCDE